MFYGIYENKDVANEFEVVYQKGSKFFKKKINTKPYFFIPTVEGEKSIYKNMYGDDVRRITFDNIFEQRTTIKKYRDKNLNFYGDLQQKYQALISFYNISRKDNTNIFKVEKDENFIAWNYDIEAFSLKTDDFITPEDASAPVQSICIQDMSENKYYVFGYFDYDITDINRYDENNNVLFTVKKEDIIYIKCNSEQELLKKFVNIIETKVNLLTGYNIDLYDNLYISNRLKKLGICYEFGNRLNLSRGVTRFGKLQTVDLYDAIKKFKAPKLENNKLDTIAKFYLGYGKVEFNGSYRDLYKNDYKKFIDYNIIDVALVYQLEKKLGVIKLMVNLANKFLCNVEDAMSLTAYVDNAIYSKALLDKKIAVQGKKSVVKEPYVGGFVLEPKRGLSGLSICADVESSYPTNIRVYNISPEKLIKYTDLSNRLFKKVLELKFKFAKELYIENKGVCRNKEGGVLKTRNLESINQLIHFFPNDKIVKNNDQLFYLSYPRMLIAYNDGGCGEIDYKTFNCKDCIVSLLDSDNNTEKVYFLYINNKQGLEKLLNTYTNINFNENLFCFYEQLITEKLINYFVDDKNRFIPFSEELKKHNLTMTPNLQFFKIDDIGLIPEFVENTFFERVKYKKLTEDYGLLINYYKTRDKSLLEKIKYKEAIQEATGIIFSSELNIDNADVISVKGLEVLKELADLDNNTLKVVINGTYGFLAFDGSRYYNKDLGEAITSAGQLTASGCRKFLINEFPNDLEQIYQDTDSCSESTIISTNDGEFMIKTLWEMSKNRIEYKNGKYIAQLPQLKTKCFNTDDEVVEYRDIKYIMKHKVNKRMFRIQMKESGNYIDVTEDHSCIVKRENQYLSVKPTEILNTDIIIEINKQTILETQTFKIIDLGVKEEDVYDLEVDDFHNFFGNNILVHNSNIFAFKEGSEVLQKINNNTTNKEKVDIVLGFYYSKMLPKINEYFNFLKQVCNRRDVAIKFDLETIMSDTFFTDMKKYCWKLIYKSGNIYEKGQEKYKHTGLSYIKSSCPVWVKPKLKKLTELLIDYKAESKFLNAYILKCKQAFKTAPILKICTPTAIQTLYNYTKESPSIPAGVDASLNYNLFLEKNNLKRFAKLTNKDKISWIYIDKNNSYGFDKIAITDDEDIIKHILDNFKIDYDKQFEATFMGLIERYFEVCNIEMYNKKSKQLF